MSFRRERCWILKCDGCGEILGTESGEGQEHFQTQADAEDVAKDFHDWGFIYRDRKRMAFCDGDCYPMRWKKSAAKRKKDQ